MFCKALIGVPLKDSEFLKLEQTHLADIIAEEEGNEHFRAEVPRILITWVRVEYGVIFYEHAIVASENRGCK